MSPAGFTSLAGFQGTLIAPDDPGYDEGRRLFNAMIDRRPALIARCTSNSDVALALALARQRGLEVSVRAGGHGVAGHAICDGGLVVDLRPMKGIQVDPASRTAVAGAGVTWGEFDAATGAYCLATTGGRVSTTGIAGLTLGSGYGLLQRKHGYTGDNLLEAELVTAGGEVLRTSLDENPELFWGLRGGGGNFGVVTSFKYRLHPVAPAILGGTLLFEGDVGDEVLRAWRDHMARAPDEIGSVVVCLTAARQPGVPEHMWGQPAISITIAYVGEASEGEIALEPLRRLPGLAVDGIEPMSYPALQRLLDPVAVPGRHQYWKSEDLRELGDDAITTCIDCGRTASSPLSLLILEAKGGMCGRLPTDATPLSRDAPFNYQAVSIWEDPTEADRHIAWARRTWTTLAPFTVPGVALNFTSDTGLKRVRSTFGEKKFRRLSAIKHQWDPENVFRSNQNIPPRPPESADARR
jgi:hypothetical protein